MDSRSAGNRHLADQQRLSRPLGICVIAITAGFLEPPTFHYGDSNEADDPVKLERG
jgi:hypothetical protein